MTFSKIAAFGKVRAGFALGALLATLAPARMEAATNRMRDLGTLGGTSSVATAINSAGQVVGHSYVKGDVEQHAFIWDGDRGMRDLGTLGGTSSEAVAINDAGQVVGHSYLAGDLVQRAFIWDEKGGMRDLGTLGGTSTVATAINARGQVVGHGRLKGDVEQHAFIWDKVTGMRGLRTLGGTSSTAVAINDDGQVVGQSDLAGDVVQHAFIWEPASGMRDLGALGKGSSIATAINAVGQVVGYDYTTSASTPRAIIWSKATGMRALGTLGGTSSVATAINDAGQAVGYGDTAGDVAQHAFIWDAVGGLRDLGTLGGARAEASAINGKGQVVGHSYTTGDKERHAFISDALGGLRDLGTLGGAYGQAVAINDAGEVVGTTALADETRHAFVWSTVADEIRDLGTLGGPSSHALAINATAQVVGQSYTASGEEHAFAWDGVNGMRDLGTLGGTSSAAYAINDAGQVVGSSDIPEADYFTTHAFIWDAATGMRDLGALGGLWSAAIAINDSGQVLCRNHTPDNTEERALVWDAITGESVDLGTLGGTSTRAVTINSAGQVVGHSFVADDTAHHAFVWDAIGGMIDLGTLGGTSSAANAVNDAGQVVGYSYTAGDIEQHAFIWDAATGMRDLGTLGGTNSSATDINDGGQVVGHYTIATKEERPFLWDPATGMRDLGTLGGSYAAALEINAAGQVIGVAVDAANIKRGFIWEAANGLRGLVTLGGTYSQARAINDAGQVVGTSLLAGDTTRHAFLITPASKDATPPRIEPQLTGQLGGGGWYTSDVVVAWVVSDAESPVESTSGCEASTVDADTNGTTLTCSASSQGGTASSSVVIRRDTAPPLITPALWDEIGAPALPGAAGWYVSPVLLEWTAEDPGSGLEQAACAGRWFVADAMPETFVCSRADVAGNVGTALVVVKVDVTAPSITCDPKPVFPLLVPGDVTATVSDATSGPAAAAVAAPADVSSPGTRTVVLAGSDVAGNVATLECPYDVVAPDTTPPSIEPQLTGNLGADDWYTSDVTVSWAVSDPESGISSTAGCDAVIIVVDTDGTTLTCTATSAGGTASISVIVRRDATAPSIHCNPSPTFSLLVSGVVTATVSDAMSGPATAAASAPADVSSPGIRNASVSASDVAGNSATAACPYEVLSGAVTPPGSDVPVTPVDPDPADPANPTPVQITFGDVTSSGSTQVASSTAGAPPPLGFKIGSPPTYYDVTTDAGYGGFVQVCVTYVDGAYKNEAKLRLLHRWDPVLCAGKPDGIDPSFDYASAGWEDATNVGFPDVANNRLCGTVTCLSPFAIVEPFEISGPAGPAAVGTALAFAAPAGTEPSAVWEFGDGTVAPAERSSDGAWAGTHSYAAAGTYVVTLTLLGPTAVLGTADLRYVVVYDPAAGFVTGGGWVASPAGAYLANPTLEGKASFGFVSRYQKGAALPTGNTQFQFKIANLTFASEHYDWLVVAGAKALFTGTGLVNGEGPFRFKLSAIDADLNANDAFTVDRFLLVIWNELSADEPFVYDSGLGSEGDEATRPISGGSIVIHAN